MCVNSMHRLILIPMSVPDGNALAVPMAVPVAFPMAASVSMGHVCARCVSNVTNVCITFLMHVYCKV